MAPIVANTAARRAMMPSPLPCDPVGIGKTRSATCLWIVRPELGAFPSLATAIGSHPSQPSSSRTRYDSAELFHSFVDDLQAVRQQSKTG